jgi:hypothetical protein
MMRAGKKLLAPRLQLLLLLRLSQLAKKGLLALVGLCWLHPVQLSSLGGQLASVACMPAVARSQRLLGWLHACQACRGLWLP